MWFISFLAVFWALCTVHYWFRLNWCTDMMSFLVEDLQGLKVSHNFEELGEGEDRILTLKDSRILDNEGTKSLVLVHFPSLWL